MLFNKAARSYEPRRDNITMPPIRVRHESGGEVIAKVSSRPAFWWKMVAAFNPLIDSPILA